MDELFRRNELVYLLTEEWYNVSDKEVSRFMTDRFEQRAYSLWAIEEIIRILDTDDSKHPVDLISDFADRMDTYACTGNKEVSWIFSIAYDVAMNALDFAISLY